MAEARGIRTSPLVLAAVLVAASVAQACLAQAGGSLAGKLTDLYSAPLGGVTLVLRNETTGAEAQTTTSKNGAYRFAGLPAGSYTLEAESDRLGRGHLNGIVVIAGHEERLQTAMQLELLAPRPFQSAALPTEAAAPAVLLTSERRSPNHNPSDEALQIVTDSVFAVKATDRGHEVCQFLQLRLQFLNLLWFHSTHLYLNV